MAKRVLFYMAIYLCAAAGANSKYDAYIEKVEFQKLAELIAPPRDHLTIKLIHLYLLYIRFCLCSHQLGIYRTSGGGMVVALRTHALV